MTLSWDEGTLEGKKRSADSTALANFLRRASATPSAAPMENSQFIISLAVIVNDDMRRRKENPEKKTFFIWFDFLSSSSHVVSSHREAHMVAWASSLSSFAGDSREKVWKKKWRKIVAYACQKKRDEKSANIVNTPRASAARANLRLEVFKLHDQAESTSKHQSQIRSFFASLLLSLRPVLTRRKRNQL